MVLKHLVGIDLRRELGEVYHLRVLFPAGDLRQLLHVFQAEAVEGLRNAVFEDVKIRLLQIRHQLAGFVIYMHIDQHLIGLRAQDESLLRTLGGWSGRLLLRQKSGGQAEDQGHTTKTQRHQGKTRGQESGS